MATIFTLYALVLVYERRFPATFLTIPISVYWLVGGLSLLWSLIFVGPTLTSYFPQLVFLHYFRRIEYMTLFFVAYEVMRSNPKFSSKVIWVLATTAGLVFVYGIGQKFWGFPAFLTMNEEFAKGLPLRLPPTARIASTFGGHYDLAAYLVLIIPILGSLVFGLGKLWQKLVFFLLAVTSLVTLLFTASRVSFGVYLVAITAMLVWAKKKWLIVPVILGSFLLLNSISGASERFYKTFRFSDVVVDLSTGKPIGTLDRLEGGSAIIRESESPGLENLPTGSEYIGVPTRPTTGGKVQLVELYKNVDLATGSGELATISGSFLIQKALVYDISITTRFQGQWPKAIEAFKRNIFLGSGFSTLSVAADGDYHRLLGETGLLGALAFVGIMFAAFFLFVKTRDRLPPLERSFVVGLFGGLVGLLLNAVLIDVFEASKVAFSFWLLLGIGVGLMASNFKEHFDYPKFLYQVFTHEIARVLYLGVVVLVLYGDSVNHYFIGDDFTWLRWAASSSFADVWGYFSDAGGFFYRAVPKVAYFILFSLFWLKPAGYHIVSLFIFISSGLALYAIMRFTKVPAGLSWLGALVYLSLSIHHENIYWLSGLSSLLATAFLYWGVYFFMRGWGSSRRPWLVSGYTFSFLAMMSHDSLVVSPLVYSLVGVGFYQLRFVGWVGPLILVPVYWWLRTRAGAYIPEGDYGYNTAKLLVNSVANLAGYLVTIPLGPKALEYVQSIRENFRALSGPLTWIFGIGLVLVSLGGWWIRKSIRHLLTSSVWFACFLVTLVAYLGQGGIAERNAIYASGFLVLFVISLLSCLWQKYAGLLTRGSIVAAILGLVVWNALEINRVGREWRFAAKVSEQALLSINKSFFPLKTPTVFAFAATPIRVGRAWIFPTGLPDALWLMFRDAPHAVIQTTTVAEAFQKTENGMDRQVLVFEDFVLKKAVKEEVPVEVSE